MKAVLPGRPSSELQALATGIWETKAYNVYATGNAFAVLTEPDVLIQTVYEDHDSVLVAVAFDESSGKIATSTRSVVRVYEPFRSDDYSRKWTLQSSFPIPTPGTPCLSWGASGELLVATTSLHLYTTSGEPTHFWEKPLPNAARIASFSPDSEYIALVGAYDSIVKVWHRLTYGTEGVLFDLACLPHPDVVTRIQWRKDHDTSSRINNALYTICADLTLHIWGASDPSDPQHLHICGKVDLSWAARDHSLYGSPCIFFLDASEVATAIENSTKSGVCQEKQRKTALDRLIAAANQKSELCFILGGGDSLSVLALENVGSASRDLGVTSVAHIESSSLMARSEAESLDTPSHVEIQAYGTPSSGQLRILLHEFTHGRIRIFEAELVDIIASHVEKPLLNLRSVWSGHSAPIQKVVRNFSGRAVVSRTAGGDSIVWRHSGQRDSPELLRQSSIPNQGHIHRICVLRKGRFVVFLKNDTISLWDCREQNAVLLSCQKYSIAGKALCLLTLPRPVPEDYQTAYIATVTSEQEGLVWEIYLPKYTRHGSRHDGRRSYANGRGHVFIREFCNFQWTDAEGLAYVLPVDPAGSVPVVSGFLDVFAKDIAISYTETGRVHFWTARVNLTERRVEWLSTCSTETGLEKPALVSGSTLKKAALVDSSRSQLFIWDIGGARLEYTEDYQTQHAIRDLDWTSTPDGQSILAVGFQHRVVLLCQMRFDYLNKGPAWAPIREINIRDLTPHPIGDSVWLGDGHLVVGAGNQLFVHGRGFDLSDARISSLQLPYRKHKVWDLFEAVQRCNGPLPVFHPQFLSQCILAGKTAIVHEVLIALHKALKYLLPGEELDDYLGLDLDDFYTENAASKVPFESHPNRFHGHPSAESDDNESFDADMAATINERLTKIGLSHLSGHQQIQLADIIECAGLVEEHRRSLDENGARFMLFFRQHALRKGRTNEIQMTWREITWAYHSTSQDILLDFVTRQYHGSIRWEHARESGMFMWLTDHHKVIMEFERIARNEYTKSDDKDPIKCSLYYLALKKKTVLQGLWRMASWHREQAATLRLLSNNFDDPRWRTAALKNAYALLSKRRFEYAAAFFLLADRLEDAVNVCLKQLKDLQLAIAVARVYEGDDGKVFRRLLEEEVLGVAAREGNRWLASWAFWMLNRKDMAVRALITPVYTLLETPLIPDMKSKLFLTDDPALVVLYSQLRRKTLQTLRGASKVTPRAEWEFVLHSAKLYGRMGCDLLGLDLVRNWEFPQPTIGASGFGRELNPIKLLRRRSSLVVDDRPASKLHTDIRSAKPAEAHPPPTIFQEPDANSLLDNFGF
ncbi:regulator of V-ATPase in vacuolar membrane protein [Sodiomyces alkalinus F11]|uniref:Regulator of V-ATPase in vacuolar membrane protein n=1 Tax=Sodiomyces alkalinus (strain CBS 110278 / VKM F-3762 / F11) TaxID=1314773 RepID=A0A3N2Q9E0_SODAK|nr:regulator of V-ATPase in vacuolar membrane protein [Sodiomyces alkalinus F11]ROT43356.1 regulator of V-ATPase in vacuolar membrane protein [Sodiomyces alkalinus F11]